MSLTTLEDYVRREIFISDKELFDFCPACDETGNTIEALMKGLFQEAKKLQKERNEILKVNRSMARSIETLKKAVEKIAIRTPSFAAADLLARCLQRVWRRRK